MVKGGRRIHYLDRKRKRSEHSRETSVTPLKQENNTLNDALMNMYKKDIMAKKENDSEDKSDGPENQLKSENMENLKTPGREKKKKSSAPVASVPTVTLGDVGGMQETLEVLHWLFVPRKMPSELVGVPCRGILLHGPPGCGKTLIARAIAGELKLPIIEVEASELVAGISGESERKIRDTFEAAVAIGKCILLIENIQAICSKSSDNAMLQRMALTLKKCFDDLNMKDPQVQVMVVGTTYDLHDIDKTLRGGERFSEEIPIGIPDRAGRLKIIEILYKNMKLSPAFSLEWLAKRTPGYVGSDLKQLAKIAGRFGCERLDKSKSKQSDSEKQSAQPMETACSNPPKLSEGKWKMCEMENVEFSKFGEMENVCEEDLRNFYFIQEDFEKALKISVPYARKEGFASVDNVSWEDVGALSEIKTELLEDIVWPIKYYDFYEENKLSTPSGILLFGPKGCGKTLVAKAIANECNLNFLSVSGPELLNMYVGESERAIRVTFERAKNSAPCVLFFDEFDALCPPRSVGSKDSSPVERVVNQLLCSSDGTNSRKQVFLLAATNRLDRIDSAMLRPGRLEKVYYIGLPSPDGRVDILKSLTKNKIKLAGDLSLEAIARDPRCEAFSGADLAALVRGATKSAVRDILYGLKDDEDLGCPKLELTHSHFNKALDVVKASISDQDRKYFQKHSSLCQGGTLQI